VTTIESTESTRQRHLRLSSISIAPGASRWQKIAVITVLTVFGIAFAWNASAALSTLVLGLIVGFTLIVGIKFFVSLKCESGTIDDKDLLPAYQCMPITVLVPMYKEASVLRQLVTGLAHMDYLPHRFRPIILLEEDDLETRRAAASIDLPENFRVVVVPASYQPSLRGKPRALEYVRLERPDLILGDVVGIYDAEDQPEPDQLRKVATALSRHPEITCVQAELRWHNAMQNWVTACLAFNYAIHYQIVLPGLAATNAVVPLGGTSNFIRLDALTHVGGWDPAHVAEDQDLGAKLKRAGYKTRMIASVTWEEALTGVHAQVKQSSRWTKGGIATTISHTRDLRWTLRDYGWWGSLTFFAMIVMSHPAALSAPIYWMMTLVYAGTQATLVQQVTPAPAFYLGTLCLLANFFFVMTGAFAALKSNQPKLIMYLPMLPIHWLVVGSQAAAIAGWEVLRGRISYWRKTEHGLVRPQLSVHELSFDASAEAAD
jgi:cellulose synthase/poly-beta-1,6-N-acetylglucosamine synthase-like glycosyltransferase